MKKRFDNWLRRKGGGCVGGLPAWSLLAALLALLIPPGARAEDIPAAAHFRKDIRPILVEYCYDCHGDGETNGNVAFDKFKSDADLLSDHNLWFKVVKNVRAGLMPPPKKDRPSAEEVKQLAAWIKYDAFGIDPKNPDPGRVTARRLNRVEYRNTIRDLMGIDFNTEVEFPPDDTGYGFDNIGDVLTLSPMLLEKYVAASRAIVAQAVPIVSRIIPETAIAGNQFHEASEDGGKGQRKGPKDPFLALPYDKPAAVSASFQAEHLGSYHLALELAVKGDFDFDPHKCRVVFKLDNRQLLQKEFGWYDNKTFPFEFKEQLPPGGHHLSVELQPLPNDSDDTNSLTMRIVSVTVRGPLEPQYWTKPKNYHRFFTKDVPEHPAERHQYARETLRNFASKAFRRPVDDETVDRLTALAEDYSSKPGRTFEAGIAHAFEAVIASPRFLFRLEESVPGTAHAAWSQVDEYSLASRLSYFLWSTMPDEELIQLAATGELRKNLPAQVKRMMNDPRSQALIQNFTGQWLQVRDVQGITIDARVVFTRDKGQERAGKLFREVFLARLAEKNPTPPPAAKRGLTNAPSGDQALTNILAAMAAEPNDQAAKALASNALAQLNPKRPGAGFRVNKPPFELDRDLRQAMKSETEMFFDSVVREDRSVTDLLDSDYTFVNEKLANVYGLTNLHVLGTEMRRVTLPPDSPRGGVLTEGTVLVVTSNPDRTSPVKRGLFVLNNILGTPTPPPPPNIPALEAAEKDSTNTEPTLRTALALHRNSPLCSSCHSRMDPIGLGMENFNALGVWRDKERNQPIEAGGKLITGETFKNVRELKHILANEHRADFYRCLTEKMLTYALGRGLEYYDVETVDEIVARLERENGHFSALMTGIIESAPFQEQRNQANATFSDAGEPSGTTDARQMAKNQGTQ